QVGVLIGAWAELKDGEKALAGIRRLPAPQLRSASGLPTTETIGQWEQTDDGRLRQTNQRAVNPFVTAMLTRNPTLRTPHLANRTDPFLKKLNEFEEYSLLNCPQKYTLLLKEFGGESVVQTVQAGEQKDTGFLAMLGMGGRKEGEGLNAAANRAHGLAT